MNATVVNSNLNSDRNPDPTSAMTTSPVGGSAAPGELPQPRSSFARVPAAFRLQFAVPSTLVWVPLMIWALSWAIGVSVLLLIATQIDGRVGEEMPLYALGASQSAIWCLAFMAAYAASHTFPFSMALSYSRRVYVLGAFLAFAVVSLGFGLAVALGAVVERLTDGFGMHLYVFDVPVLTDSAGIAGAGVLATVLCLFAMFLGFFWAILYRRVTLFMLWCVIIGFTLVMVGLVALVTQQEGWMSVWTWILDQTTLSLAAWLGLGTLILGGLNYVLIRKATI